MTRPPKWLAERITAAARAAKPNRCTVCDTDVLVGLDADVCAGTAIVDPAPLDRVGEAIARAQGRRTYTLTTAGGRAELDLRGPIEVASPRRRWPVLAAHVCGSPPLPAAPAPPPSATSTDTDVPPF